MAEVAEVAQVVEVDFIPVVQETEIAVVRAFFRADRVDEFRPVLNWRGLVDLAVGVVGVVGPRHIHGVGKVVVVVGVTPVEAVESIPVVVGEDLIMSGEINKITCITGHLLVMVW